MQQVCSHFKSLFNSLLTQTVVFKFRGNRPEDIKIRKMFSTI